MAAKRLDLNKCISSLPCSVPSCVDSADQRDHKSERHAHANSNLRTGSGREGRSAQMSPTLPRPTIPFEPLQRDTLQDRVYGQLAGLILDGGIPPGQLVTIQRLAEALGVSTMPVREALK